MADSHTRPRRDLTTSPQDVDCPATLFIVLLVVLGLAAGEHRAFELGLGKYALPLQLAIGSRAGGLVAYYFMHLRQGDKVVILTALSSIFWMGILFVLFLADYMTRLKVVN